MQLKDVMPSLFISLVMAIPVYLLTFLPLSYYIILPIQLIVGCLIAFVLCEYYKLEEYLQLKTIILDKIVRR